MSVQGPRFEVLRTENGDASAKFEFLVHKKCDSIGEQDSPVYRCFKENIYVKFRISFLDQRGIQFYINATVYDSDVTYSLSLNLSCPSRSNCEFNSSIGTTIDWKYLYQFQMQKDTEIYMIYIAQKTTSRIEIFTLNKQLHEDEESADIKLRGEEEDSDAEADATVRFHRIFLANCSEVLRSMVSGEWREAKEGVARLPTDTDTLRHFKEYVYLRKLPHDGLKCSRLLSLANYCMMPELAAACTEIMAADTQPEAIWNWLEHCVLTKNIDQLSVLMRSRYCAQDLVQMAKFIKDKESDNRVKKSNKAKCANKVDPTK